MDEELLEELKDGVDGNIYLGTVVSWNSATGVKIKLDGQDSAMTKPFKMLITGRTLRNGERVVLIKHSGTYIVLGKIEKPLTYYHPSDLSSSATQSQIITRCNLILSILRHTGIIMDP